MEATSYKSTHTVLACVRACAGHTNTEACHTAEQPKQWNLLAYAGCTQKRVIPECSLHVNVNRFCYARAVTTYTENNQQLSKSVFLLFE